MAKSTLVDAGFLVALMSRRDAHHRWAIEQALENAPPWQTCDAVLSEAFHLVGQRGAPALSDLLLRKAVVASFSLGSDMESVVALLRKYSGVPMSLADACLVRMSEIIPDPVILTTDSDFHIYRRHGRQVVPYIAPR